MISLILTSLISGIVGSMIGYAFRVDDDRMRIRYLLDECHKQLVTILKHEKTIETLRYVANERSRLVTKNAHDGKN